MPDRVGCVYSTYFTERSCLKNSKPEAQYFDIEYSGCRNMWHMTARVARKLLAYNVGVLFNVQAGKPAIQFENLIAA